MHPQFGFWNGNDHAAPRKCPNPFACPGRLPGDEDDGGGLPPADGCAHGHDGVLCAECAPDHYKFGCVCVLSVSVCLVCALCVCALCVCVLVMVVAVV